jgi:hypothetical protein
MAGSLILIHIAIADPDPEGGKSAQKRRKITGKYENQKKFKILFVLCSHTRSGRR